MFNLSFYIIWWLLFFLLCLPIIFAGLFAIALDTEKVEVAENRLKNISDEINQNINDKAKLKVLLEDFLSNFKNYSKDAEDYNLWLDISFCLVFFLDLLQI